MTNEKPQRWQFVLVCDEYENVTGTSRRFKNKNMTKRHMSIKDRDTVQERHDSTNYIINIVVHTQTNREKSPLMLIEDIIIMRPPSRI